MSDLLYLKAHKFLKKEYEENYKIVRKSPFHKLYMDEKFKHSLQVSGAGNGILRHEAYFQNKSESFVDIARTAILLHDIYRFREIKLLFETGQKIDHGLKGAEFLSQTKDFDDILITLPIKHHGHMIEKLYEDQAFQSLDAKTKEDVKHISFAVRDADKIANWYLLSYAFYDIRELWLTHPNDFSKEQAQTSPQLWHYFKQMRVAPNNLRKTNTDSILSVMCWLFDINYSYSISYCKKLNLFEKWGKILAEFHVDAEKIREINEIMSRFVAYKFHTEICI